MIWTLSILYTDIYVCNIVEDIMEMLNSLKLRLDMWDYAPISSQLI